MQTEAFVQYVTPDLQKTCRPLFGAGRAHNDVSSRHASTQGRRGGDDNPTERRMKERQVRDEMAAGRPGRPRGFWAGWSLALGLAVVVVGLASLPPFVGPDLRAALMQGFSTMCHQFPSRSPHIDGVPLAVCHRCFGIYAGLPLAVLGFLLMGRWDETLGRYAPLLLFGALVPPGLDWLLDVLGVWHNTPLSRLATGAIFGLVAGYYLARAFSQAFDTSASQPATTTGSQHPEENAQTA